MMRSVDERRLVATDGEPEMGNAGFEHLACMAMIERGGTILARNALARRMTGYSGEGQEDPEVFRIESALLGAFRLEDETGHAKTARVRFDCLLTRRHGAPMAVHAVAQWTQHGGADCRLIVLLERCDSLSGTGDEEVSLVEDILDATPEASVMTHSGRVLHVNREFTRLFGYSAVESVGRDLAELVVPEGLMHEAEVIQHTLQAQGRVSIETKRRARSGELMDVCVLIAKVRLGSRASGMLVTYRDIRSQKREAERLKHTARHDGLTGLPNRAAFLEQVSLTLARLRRRPDRGFAVIFMDLDGFKKVNDTLGHAAGDKLLLIVADRLTKCLRPQDSVARFGGDEFALLLDESGAEFDVEAVAARIQAEVLEPMTIDGAEAQVSASMGIVIAQTAYQTAEEMMRHADSAMYLAKADGGGQHVACRMAEEPK